MEFQSIERFLTVAELTQRWGCSHKYLKDEVIEGELPPAIYVNDPLDFKTREGVCTFHDDTAYPEEEDDLDGIFGQSYKNRGFIFLLAPVREGIDKAAFLLFCKVGDRHKGIVCKLKSPLPLEKYWNQMVFDLADVAKIEARGYIQIEHAAVQLAQDQWRDGSDRKLMIAALRASYQSTGLDVKNALNEEDDSYLLNCVRLNSEKQIQTHIDALIKDGALRFWQMPSMTPATSKIGAFVLKSELMQAIKNRRPSAQPLVDTESKQKPSDGGSGAVAAKNDEREKLRAEIELIATEYISQCADSDTFPSQVAIADRVAKILRERSVMGVSGKPLTGVSIKRQYLNGITSNKPLNPPKK